MEWRGRGEVKVQVAVQITQIWFFTRQQQQHLVKKNSYDECENGDKQWQRSIMRSRAEEYLLTRKIKKYK